MAIKVLLVVLAISMLLTSGTERSDEVSPRGRRLCLCSNRVLRLSSQDSEALSSASCEEMCTFNNKAGVLSNLSRRHLRSRRDIDVLEEAEKCEFNKYRPDWKIKNVAVAFHRSQNSSVWFAEISWSPFKGSSHLWIGYYFVYFTGSPRQSSIAHCKIFSKDQTSVNISSTEKEETISLNVTVLPKFLNSNITYVRIDLKAYSKDKEKLLAVTPPRYKMEPTKGKITVVTYVSVVVGILTGVVLGASLLRYCLCRPKNPYFPPEFIYHAFIIYQKEDSSWMSKELLPFLEEEHHIKCCIHYRDFTPGIPFTESMAESVNKSYKIIAVISSNFMKSPYCLYELDLSKYRLATRRDDSLILIRIDKTDPSELPSSLQKRNFIDYSDVLERPFWKARLLKFLNSGSKSVSAGTDNNNSAVEDSNVQNEQRQVRAEFDRLNSTISSQSVSAETGNTNSALEDSNVQNERRQVRAEFDRLNSTISTDTEISIVSLNEERLI